MASGYFDPNTAWQPSAHFDIEKMMRVRKEAQEMAGANALKQLFADPANVQNGQPTQNALQKLYAINPELALQASSQASSAQMRQSEAAEAQRKAKHEMLVEEATGVMGVYRSTLDKGLPQDQAMALAQTEDAKRRAALVSGGRLTKQELDQLPPSFDPNQYEMAITGYAKQQEMRRQEVAQARADRREDRQTAQGDERLDLERRRLNQSSLKPQAIVGKGPNGEETRRTVFVRPDDNGNPVYMDANGNPTTLKPDEVLDKQGTDRPGSSRVAAHLSPSAVKYAADQYRATGKLPPLGYAGTEAKAAILQQAAEDAVANGASGLSDLTSQAGVKGDASSIVAMTKNVDFSTAFENNMMLNIGILRDLMDKGAGTPAGPVVNRWLQAGRVATGDPDVAAFHAAVETVSAEYGRIMVGGAQSIAMMPEGARKMAEELLPKFGSPQAINNIIDKVIIPDTKIKIKSYENQLKTAEKRIQSSIKTSPAPPASPAAAPPPAAGEKPPAGAPAGGANADAIAKARAAIAKGAPRDAVIKRLQDAGIDTGGL